MLNIRRKACQRQNRNGPATSFPVIKNIKIFVYLIVDVNGKIDEETVYKRTTTVPAIVRSPESGKIYVTGGTHAKKKRDYK